MDRGAKPSLKLMIVDDSNIIRRRIERSQQIDRLEVVGAASNGREAVDLFRRTQPDVVTMDLTMPRWTAWNAFKNWWPSIPRC